MTKNLTLFLFFSIFNIADSFAQNSEKKISGQVIDGNKHPIQAVGVSLRDNNDRVVQQSPTDSLGRFQLFYAPPGKYTLSITHAGFQTYESPQFDLQDRDFGILTLAASTQNLKEVVIQAQAELITIEPNAVVYNVSKSIDAQGTSAFDALRKAPGVYIENERTILLNGKAGTTILIDGKQTYLSGADLIDLLKSMPSSNIRSFEMINSPSAKYDASGAAGMINIRTIKSQVKGFNGSLTSGLIYGSTLKNVQDVSFNYRKNKLNIFGSYNHFLGYRTYDYGSYRIQEGKMFDSHTDDTDKRMNMGSRVGVDYNLDRNNTLGVLFNAASVFGGGLTQTRTRIGQGTTTQIDQILDAENDYYYQKTMRYAANVNYKYEDTAGRIINFDVDFSLFDKGNANRQTNRYSKNQVVVDNHLYRSLTDIDMSLKGIRLDYTTNFLSGKLETGLKYADIISQNEAKFFHQLATRDSVDDRRTSSFKYSEQVGAAYVNYKKNMGVWGFQLGLRLENTRSGGILRYQSNGVGVEEKTPRNYTDLFPSVSLSFQPSKNSGYSISYSRRIDRPTYPDLNPFVYLLDDVSYWQGNPYLLPQMTHRAMLQYVYKSSTILWLTYSYTDQYSSKVNDGVPNSSIVIFRPLNLGTQKNIALSLTQNLIVTNWWKLNLNGSIFGVKNQIAFDQYRSFNLTQTAARLNIQQTFNLPAKITADLSGTLNSRRLIGANEIAKGMNQVDIGFQRKFLSDRATIRMVVNDLYKGNQSKSVQSYTGFYLRNYGYYESRQVRLNFTYRFADSSVKGPRSRSSSLENENGRIR